MVKQINAELFLNIVKHIEINLSDVDKETKLAIMEYLNGIYHNKTISIGSTINHIYFKGKLNGMITTATGRISDYIESDIVKLICYDVLINVDDCHKIEYPEYGSSSYDIMIELDLDKLKGNLK